MSKCERCCCIFHLVAIQVGSLSLWWREQKSVYYSHRTDHILSPAIKVKQKAIVKETRMRNHSRSRKWIFKFYSVFPQINSISTFLIHIEESIRRITAKSNKKLKYRNFAPKLNLCLRLFFYLLCVRCSYRPDAERGLASIIPFHNFISIQIYCIYPFFLHT